MFTYSVFFCFQEKNIFSGMFKKTPKPSEGTTTDEVQQWLYLHIHINMYHNIWLFVLFTCFPVQELNEDTKLSDSCENLLEANKAKVHKLSHIFCFLCSAVNYYLNINMRVFHVSGEDGRTGRDLQEASKSVSMRSRWEGNLTNMFYLFFMWWCASSVVV